MRALKWMMFLMALSGTSFAGNCLAPESPYQKMRCAELLGPYHTSSPMGALKKNKNIQPAPLQETAPPIRVSPQQNQPRITTTPQKPTTQAKIITQPSPQKPAQQAPQYGTSPPKKQNYRFKLY